MDNDKTIQDCVIIALVRSSFRVKLNNAIIFVQPFTDNGQYGKGVCSTTVEGGDVVVRGEKRTPSQGYQHKELFRVSLAEPQCFERLAIEIQRYFGSRT